MFEIIENFETYDTDGIFQMPLRLLPLLTVWACGTAFSLTFCVSYAVGTLIKILKPHRVIELNTQIDRDIHSALIQFFGLVLLISTLFSLDLVIWLLSGTVLTITGAIIIGINSIAHTWSETDPVKTNRKSAYIFTLTGGITLVITFIRLLVIALENSFK